MPYYEYRGNEPGIKARMGREPRPFDPTLCGTNKGIWQHRRDKQPNCPKCAAHYNAGRRRKYREGG